MELTAFKFEITDEGVARITLNQGKRGNPFDAAFTEEFNKIAIECDTNPAVRAVLINADGPYFSVGGDLKTFVKGDQQSLAQFIKTATSNIHMAVSRLARMDAPVVVYCDALVAGGGVSLVSGADFLLSGPKASFYGAFAAIGFSCDCGASYYLPRRVGARRAFSFFARNENWSAETALEYGLVSEIHSSETLQEEAEKLARQLAAGPTYTFGKLKDLFLSTYSNTLETQLEMESRALADCARSDDAWNAVNAVANKQKAVFKYKSK